MVTTRTEGRRRASDRPDILERLSTGVVLGDGGYLLELEKRGYVQAGPSTPECVLEHPEAVEELHREFVDAGAEVLQALAFYASKEKLATTGHARQTRDLGIDYVGSCCGSIPVHVREMARALGKRSSDKAWRIDYSKLMSAFEYYEHGAASK